MVSPLGLLKSNRSFIILALDSLITQEVGDINLFLNIFSTRIRDISFQNSHSDITTKSKLRSYCEFKSLLVPEKYPCCIPYFHKRRALSRLRCSDHPLRIETGRWSNIPPNEHFCELCNSDSIEDEYHFVLKCPFFSDFRQKYIPFSYWSNPTFGKFEQLMESNDEKIVISLVDFVYIALKVRYNIHHQN